MQDTGPEYTSIAELAARSGISVPCAGNLPVKLDEPDSVWFIDQGAVNLFLVEFKHGVEQAAPQHLMRREVGLAAAGRRAGRTGKRRRDHAQPGRQGIAGNPAETPARIAPVRGSSGGAGGTDRYLADRPYRHALAFREPPSASDGAGRTRHDADTGPLHAIGAARSRMGIRAAARRRACSWTSWTRPKLPVGERPPTKLRYR